MILRTKKQAAEYLGVTPQWLQRHTRQGLGPITLRIKGVVHYAMPEMPEWIDCKPVSDETEPEKTQPNTPIESSND